jgi:hypothetical protein
VICHCNHHCHCPWHEYLDMVLCFKITHGLVSLKPSVVLRICTTRYTRSSSNMDVVKYAIPNCETTMYRRSFSKRTIRTWNTLDDKLNLCMDSLNSFKLRYYFISLESTYDCEDPQIFKSICLRFNSSCSLTHPLNCCY